MDTTPAEPSCSSDARFVSAALEPREAQRAPYKCSVLRSQESYLMAAGALDLVLSADHGKPRWPVDYAQSITDHVADLRVVLDALDEAQEPDVAPVLHLSGNGSASSQPLTLFIECKAWCGAEPTIILDTLSPDARLSAPVLTYLSACATAVSASALPGVDAEVGVHWRGLPRYGERLFQLRTCCGISTLTPEAALAAWAPKPTTLDLGATRAERFYNVGMRLFFAPITATIRDRRFIRDYREGLRRFLSGVLTLLHLMVVTLLAALSHLARTPSFLLVMLATARRYGHRGDGDSHLMAAPTWHLRRPWGATRLAT
jgi:hypothetical protein